MNDLTPNRLEAERYLESAFQDKGVGGWRALYLEIIAALKPEAVIELGSGAPDFLLRTGASRAIAVDLGDRYKDVFEAAGVRFLQRDLDRDRLADVGQVDLAICSDVFEHLIHPMFALDSIAEILPPAGVLLSHVPNEYRLGPALGIMLGRRETTQFHTASREWDDPHFRRFSERGYLAFLQHRFRYNLPLADLRYAGVAKWLGRLGVTPPYCLQGGPTFASCNDAATYERLVAIKVRLKHR